MPGPRRKLKRDDFPSPPNVPGAAWIPLGNGHFALVDAADAPRIGAYAWYRGGHGYAAGFIEGRHVLMHRFIMEATPAHIVDHKSWDKLDNRRDNLRLATRSRNLANGRKFRGRSQYRGVWYHPLRGRWYASIKADGTRRNLGSYVGEVDAATAYDAAARELHGEFARLNFPREGERGARST